VQHKETGQYYAMKIINKDFMLEKNQVRFFSFSSSTKLLSVLNSIFPLKLAHARAERDAMVEHDDPGIVTLYYSFQVFYITVL